MRSHALDDGSETPAAHWEAIESTPGLQGGFIREFWDHGILRRVNDGGPAGRGGAGLYEHGVTAPGHRRAHRGDFGEAIRAGAFVAEGVSFPDRTPRPVVSEHRGITAPVRLAYAGSELQVTLVSSAARPGPPVEADEDDPLVPPLRTAASVPPPCRTPSGHDEPGGTAPRRRAVGLDAAHRGLDTASRGPDTSPGRVVRSGTHRRSRTPRLL